MKIQLGGLKSRIENKLPELSPSQKTVAEFFLKNPEKISMGSLRGLEKELGISKSTIVRLAQGLGYDGFNELKSDFLEELSREIRPINRYKNYLNEETKPKDPLSIIAKEALTNITETFEHIDKQQFEKAVAILEKADRVFCMGRGISAYVAEMAAYLLNRVAVSAMALRNSGLSFSEQVLTLKPGEVIFVFSFQPYAAMTVEAAQLAKNRGHRLVLITDQLDNSVAAFSDATILAKVDSITMSNSVMSVITLLYALSFRIGSDTKGKTLKTLESLHKLGRQ